MAGNPFIKKFITGGQYYIYDVNSNHVLNVDKVIYSVIDFWNIYSLEEVKKVFCSKFPSHKLRDAWRNISSFARQGFFSSFRPKGVNYYKSFKEARKRLQSELRQLILNVTENCNLRCKYCAYSGHYKYRRKHCQRNMSKDIAFKAVDFFLPNSDRQQEVTIGFYGGEPFLNFKLIEDVVMYARKKAKDRKISFNATTNGTIITDKILDFIVKNNIMLLVSLDGPEDIHDRYRVFRNSRGSFRVVKKNLERILTYDKNYYERNISFNLVMGPPRRLVKIYDFINREELFKKALFSVSDVEEQGTDFFNHFSKKELRNDDYGRMEKCFFNLVIKDRKIKNTFLQRLIGDGLLRIYKRDIGYKMGQYEHPNGTCVPGLRRIFVSTEGKLHMCEKINEYLSIGDVECGLDMKEIEFIMKEYVERSSPRCRECWAVRLCSLCFVQALTDKLDFEEKERNCKAHRKSLLYCLKLYCRILEKSPDALEYMEDITLS